jgi:hypothetical protein
MRFGWLRRHTEGPFDRKIPCPAGSHALGWGDVMWAHPGPEAECAHAKIPVKRPGFRPVGRRGSTPEFPQCHQCGRRLRPICPTHGIDLSIYLRLQDLHRALCVLLFGSTGSGKSSLILALYFQLMRNLSRTVAPHCFDAIQKAEFLRRYEVFRACGRFPDILEVPPIALDVTPTGGDAEKRLSLLFQDVPGESAVDPNVEAFITACCLLEHNHGVIATLDPLCETGMLQTLRPGRVLTPDERSRLDHVRQWAVLGNLADVVSHHRQAFARTRLALVVTKADQLVEGAAWDPERLMQLACPELQSAVRLLRELFRDRCALFSVSAFDRDPTGGTATESGELLCPRPRGLRMLFDYLLPDLGWSLLSGDGAEG